MVDGREDNVSAFYTTLHEGDKHCHANDDSGADAAKLHKFLVTFLYANFFWYFSVHI
jgi:hypothetical protein